MPPFPATIYLSSLNGTNGFRLGGVAAGDEAGFCVGSAGDLNGDGYGDVIVGARWADPHGSNSGASYVVFGKASGFAANLQLSSLDGGNGFRLSGVAADDGSGNPVASAGDVNGDGFADIIIGAPSSDAHGLNSGASYVLFGKASGFSANIDLSSLDGSNGFRLASAEDDRSGWSAASAGDVNGDDITDLIIGAVTADPHGTSSGAAYVVFGRTSGFPADFDLSSVNGSNGFKLSGIAPIDETGWSVDSAGDVNGDGLADLLIGARLADPHGIESGESYVVFGKTSGFASNIDLSSLDGSNGFKLSGVAAGDQSGWSLATAGDINGDGFADLIIGSYGADPHGDRSGAAYVVFGKASGFAANFDLSTLNGSNGFRLSGTYAGDHAGWSVRSAGDVDGDGFADVIVGSQVNNSYVVFGKASGFSANIELSSLNGSNGFKLVGSEQAGFSVASAGDVNADGFADMIIGAPSTLGGTGSSYVVFGHGTGSGQTLTGTDGPDTLVGTAFNDTLSGLGGDDTLTGAGGLDKIYGGDGNDTLVVNNGDVVAGEVYDGGAGSDTLLLANATTADFSGVTLSGLEILQGSSGNDSIILTGTQVGAFGSIDGGAGIDTVTFRFAGSADVSPFAPPVITNVETLQVVGSSGNDTLTLNVQEFTGVNTINLGAGSDTLTVALSGPTDFTTLPFPALAGVEALNLTGTGDVRLTVAQLDQVTSIAPGLTATLADTGQNLKRLAPAQLATLGPKGVDIVDATDNVLKLGVAQLQALGTVQLAAGDTVTLKDTAANLMALSPAQIGALAGQGVDLLNATDDVLTFSVAQAGSFGSVVMNGGDLVTVADSGGRLAGLTAAEIASLGAARVDVLDATNDTLKLAVDQALALGRLALTPADTVVLADTGAHIAALTPGQVGNLATKGFDTLDASDDAISLAVAQVQALGAITVAGGDAATLADSGAHIAALTASQIAALNGQGIDRIDATNNALALGADQFGALGRTLLSAGDVLTLAGTAGDDKLSFSRQPFNPLDRVDGLGGNDTLALAGDFSAGLVLHPTTMANVEKLALVEGFSYDLTTTDATVAAGQRLLVTGANLGALDSLAFDGSAESDGRFKFMGGAGANTFTGGTGADDVVAGSGNDLVRYTAAAQSTSTGYDTLTGFDAALDHLHVWSGVVAVDAPITTGNLSKGSFDADLAAATGSLLAQHAVLFTADGGSLAGQPFLVVDANGAAGYQAGADLVVRLDGAAHLDQFGAATFT